MNTPAVDAQENVEKDMHLNFVREYHVSDVGVCDKLIELFQTAKRLGFTGPGRTGNFEVKKEIKDSEDFAVEGLPKGHSEIPSPSASGFTSVMQQFSDFIPRYYTDVDASWRQEVEFKFLPHFQHYEPGGGYHTWHCDSTGDTVNRHLVFFCI